jgi:signal transduction histidine kinase/ligand-binding sensor domain-containing protein
MEYWRDGGRVWKSARSCLHFAIGLWFASFGQAAIRGAAQDPGALLRTGYWLIKTWTTEEGLPGSDVTAIAQTPDGYLWLGTFDGLARFDGMRFTLFDRSNTPELPSNAVVNLHLDQKGVLWISTDRGMVSLQDGHWRTYQREQGWTGDYVRTFAEGAGKLLVTSFDGKVFQFRENRFEELPEPPGQRGSGYVGHVDELGRFWVFQGKYFGCWEGNHWSPTVEATLSDNSEVMAGSARDGGLWVYHHGRLDKFRSGQVVQRIDVPQPLFAHWSLTEDWEGNVWLASYKSGVARFLPDESMEHYSTTNGLPTSRIRCVFEDREGDRWIGTSGGGLVRLNRRAIQAFGEDFPLPKGPVQSVAVGKNGNIYVGNYGGGVACLDRMGLPRNRPVKILTDHGLTSCVLADRAGRVWAAQAGKGLLCFDGDRVSTNDVLSMPDKDALALFEDSHDRIWLSDHKRVLFLEHGKWTPATPEPGLVLEAVRAFAEDRKADLLWLGAYNGDLYQCSKGVIRRFALNGESMKLPIIALLADEDGTLWMGSDGGGLGRLRQGQARWINQSRGLPASDVGCVLDDGLGNLWLGSNRGIIRVARSEVNGVAEGRQSRIRCRLFDKQDGMPVNECSGANQPSGARDQNGLLWFATQKGVVLVPPRWLTNETNPPPVWIESVEYVGPDGKAHHVTQPLANLIMPAGTKRLQIRYTGISLSSPEKVTFRERVEGVDQDWVDVGHERSATFQELGPGAFRFRITAANAAGIWNPEGQTLAYTVLPLVWQTGWFRGFIGLLVAAEGALIAGLVISHWRSNQLRLELRDNQERWDLASVAAKLGLWTWDIHTNRFWVTENAYALLGQPSSQSMTFAQLAEFQHPDDREAAHKALQRALEHEHEYDAEFRVLLPDGEPRWLGARGLVDFDKQGKPIRLRGVWIDLSTRKQLEIEGVRHRTELAHMGRVAILGELSGSLAHEVNQPLAAILSNAQAAQRFLEQNPPNRSELREILADIVEEDRRAGEVIRRMRSMLKKGMPEFQSLDVNRTVDQVLSLMRSDLIARNVGAVTRLAPCLPLVKGDSIQIQQVLMNLIFNGCEAMQEAALPNQELVLETERDGADQVRISVIDRGAGVPGAMLEKIFEPFVTTKSAGLGMGLSLCRSIVAAHGGRIWAARNQGRGLTLSFTLRVNLEGKP